MSTIKQLTLYYPPLDKEGKVLHHDELGDCEAWNVVIRYAGYLYSAKMNCKRIVSLVKRGIVSHDVRVACGLPSQEPALGELTEEEIMEVSSLPYEVFCEACGKYSNRFADEVLACQYCGMPAKWHVEKDGMFRKYIPKIANG